jgi:methyl-accepting chemotaxis protein
MKKYLNLYINYSKKISKIMDKSFINPNYNINKIINLLEKRESKKLEKIPSWVKLKEKNKNGYKDINDFYDLLEIERKNKSKIIYKLYKIEEISLSNLILELKYIYQKTKNGYSDRDVYELDLSLCSTLGRQLDHFSKITQSFPENYKTLKSFKKDIKKASNNLLALKLGSEKTKILNEKYNKIIESDKNSKELHSLANKIARSEVNDLKKAKGSLIWVSTNLEHLWV